MQNVIRHAEIPYKFHMMQKMHTIFHNVHNSFRMYIDDAHENNYLDCKLYIWVKNRDNYLISHGMQI